MALADPFDETRRWTYRQYADDMEIELVPDSGHFVVEEKPDLVVQRAREFFG